MTIAIPAVVTTAALIPNAIWVSAVLFDEHRSRTWAALRRADAVGSVADLGGREAAVKIDFALEA
ncbi:MAG: hypothetical protein R3A52_14360 [Polyangiales bacterium]